MGREERKGVSDRRRGWENGMGGVDGTGGVDGRMGRERKGEEKGERRGI